MAWRHRFADRKRKTLLFLKKKKQKDFYSMVARAPHRRRIPAKPAWARQPQKSLFASFSSEKEESFLPTLFCNVAPSGSPVAT
jgi:hypothetical protein